MNTEPQNSTATLIDFEQLNSACDGDTALMRELMDMYFGQADEIMSGLSVAVQNKSIPDVNHLSHKLAGSSLACGLSAIAPSLRAMEKAAKAGHLDGVDGFFAEAVSNLELLRVAVQDHLKAKA